MALETIPLFPNGLITTSSEYDGFIVLGYFPDINPLPDNGIYNITQCIGGGIDLNQSPDPNGFGGILIDFDGANYINNFQPLLIDFNAGGRNFSHQHIDIISASSIPAKEVISYNGIGQSNCSLSNRAYQAKKLITMENNTNDNYMYYGDSLNPTLTDKSDPAYYDIILSIEDIPPHNGSVFESAYFYQENIDDNSIIDHYYRGVNVLDDEQENGWVIKNGSSDHEDWSYTHSSSPNLNPYISFNDDHWWIYDFGENNSKPISRVDIVFSDNNTHRHFLVEISGSNDPNIFTTNPNISNVEGDHWDNLGELINNEADINDGKAYGLIDNTTPYRWYKITFKGGYFEDDELSITEFDFLEHKLVVPQINMSDFYGLHFIDTIPNSNHNFVGQFGSIPSYNSGHRIGVLSTDIEGNQIIPQIRLGGGP